MPDIPVWNKCDNRCVMCTNSPAFARQDGAQYGLRCQIEKLERYIRGLSPVYLKNSGDAGFVALTGGEPTLHPDFIKLVAYFRRRLPGTPITLLSNGRHFADLDFTLRFLKAAAPPFAVAVPLHAASARAHDAVSGVRGSFAQTVRGLENILSRPAGPGVEIRIVLHRKNINELSSLLKFILRRFPALPRYRVVIIHYEIEGMSEANHKDLALKLSESAAELKRNLPVIRRFPDLRLYHFPLCVLSPGLRPLARVTLTREDRIYPAVCRGCARRRACLGLMAEYSKFFGNSELRRLKR